MSYLAVIVDYELSFMFCRNEKMTRVLLASVFLLHLFCQLTSAQTATIHIGAVLANEKHEELFMKLIENLTAPQNYVYKGVPILIGANPVVTANNICDNLLQQQVSY